MTLLRLAAVIPLVLAAGCQSGPARQSTQGRPSGDIASEVTRICALPSPEREAALEKLKKDSGMVLFCGSKE